MFTLLDGYMIDTWFVLLCGVLLKAKALDFEITPKYRYTVTVAVPKEKD